MNLDKTFCASPNCRNKCGVKYTNEFKQAAEKSRPNYGVSIAFLCDENGDLIDEI